MSDDQDFKNIPKSRHDASTNSIWFGNLTPHWKTGYEVVFISTYTLTYGQLMYTVVARLPDLNGHQRYINIENPNHDGFNPKNPTPYSVRPHPIVNGAVAKCMNSVNIAISYGENLGEVVNLKRVGARETVSTHRGTFSPNNMHLNGLPCRILRENEIFGFCTHVFAEEKKLKVDTFHLLTGDPEPFVNMGIESSTLGEFLERVVQHSTTKDESFQSNTRKLLNFVDGVSAPKQSEATGSKEKVEASPRHIPGMPPQGMNQQKPKYKAKVEKSGGASGGGAAKPKAASAPAPTPVAAPAPSPSPTDPPAPSPSDASSPSPSPSDPPALSALSALSVSLTGEEKGKRLKALRKKLKQIAELKAKGETEGDAALNDDQREKIKTEPAILEEITDLEKP